MILLLLLSIFEASALEVIKFENIKNIELRIVRAEPDSFSTYALFNHNGREMTLVCANNPFYDKNPLPFIEYRNYYNEIVGRFTLHENKVCADMGRYIENVQSGISVDFPFIIKLNTKKMKVERVVYPQIDQFIDDDPLYKELPEKPLNKLKTSDPF